ncbi:hypothetical protein [Mammaliicoccus sciuri]|uniref:hypothetical protein n=1 Tax=Mammaliicoccus sciuri TaxID=1296 RepID=UPI000D1FCCDF|nr:hypothetical protein [Mammaliicoccus sciuri]PTJ54225.1 hypothetical protein BU012_01110 [Mammaliicoccus sciuri]
MAAKYNLTNHAYQRYTQRVKKSSEAQVLNRLTQLLETCTVSEPGNQGSTIYYAKGLAIVLAPDNYTIATVYPKDADVLNSDLFASIIDVVKSEVFKEERQLKAEKRRLLIEMHEAEIRKLKVFNPDTQSIIQRKIDAIRENVTKINDRLDQANAVRRKFNIA